MIDAIGNRQGYKELAEKLRDEANNYHNATDQERISQVIAHVEKLFESYQWARASTLIERLIKAEPGLLGWICVHSTDNGGDIHVRVWDSETATTAGDVVVSEIYVTTTRLGAHRHDTYPLPGIECAKGIYIEVVAGDCSIVIGYK